MQYNLRGLYHCVLQICIELSQLGKLHRGHGQSLANEDHNTDEEYYDKK